MANTELQDLTQGTLPKFIYGTNQSDQSRKFNALGFKNVKDYGAVGDGSTDDTSAIQAAIDDANAPFSATARGTIYFPRGNYITSAALDVITSIRAIRFQGAAGARITGNFADAIIKRPVDSPFSGIYIIDGLEIYNSHATGVGILWHSCVGAVITGCAINAWRGIETYNSQCVLIAGTDIIRGVGTKATSIGIVAGNATNLIATDITSYGKGLVHQNLGLLVHGGRFEVNETAIVIGEDENGALFQSSSIDIKGPSMEANQVGLHIRSGVAGQVSFNQGAGVECTTGLLVNNCTEFLFSGISISSAIGFTDAAIAIEGPIARCAFNGVNGTSFRVDDGSIQSATFDNWGGPAFNSGTLPSAPAAGAKYHVDDATTPAIGSAYTGGGAVEAVVMAETDGGYLVVGL